MRNERAMNGVWVTRKSSLVDASLFCRRVKVSNVLERNSISIVQNLTISFTWIEGSGIWILFKFWPYIRSEISDFGSMIPEKLGIFFFFTILTENCSQVFFSCLKCEDYISWNNDGWDLWDGTNTEWTHSSNNVNILFCGKFSVLREFVICLMRRAVACLR